MRILWCLAFVFFAAAVSFAAACDTYSSCSSCAAQSDCKWCMGSNTCSNLSTASGECAGSDWALTTGACSCAGYSTCQSCADQMSCKWCKSSGACHPLGSDACSGDWAVVTSSCPGGGASPTPTPSHTATPAVTATRTPTPAQAGCGTYNSCSSCAAQSDCKWCIGSSTCYNMSDDSRICPGEEWALISGMCPGAAANCTGHQTCQSCAEQIVCRWCKSSNTCMSITAPPSACSGGDWAISSSQCPSSTPARQPVVDQRPTLGCCPIGFLLAALALGAAAYGKGGGQKYY